MKMYNQKSTEAIARYFKTHAARYGLDVVAAMRLLSYGEKTILTWLVRTVGLGVENVSITAELEEFARLFDVSLSQVRYAYYNAPEKSTQELIDTEGYSSMLDYLEKHYGARGLFESLSKVALHNVRRLAVYAAQHEGLSYRDSGKPFGISRAYWDRERNLNQAGKEEKNGEE